MYWWDTRRKMPVIIRKGVCFISLIPWIVAAVIMRESNTWNSPIFVSNSHSSSPIHLPPHLLFLSFFILFHFSLSIFYVFEWLRRLRFSFLFHFRTHGCKHMNKYWTRKIDKIDKKSSVKGNSFKKLNEKMMKIYDRLRYMMDGDEKTWKNSIYLQLVQPILPVGLSNRNA